MKILLTTAGLLTAALLTACGGSAGHSDSYNKGSDWATANQQTASIQVGFLGIDGVCHAFATQQALGLNPAGMDPRLQRWSE
jgi:hypothetical protein